MKLYSVLASLLLLQSHVALGQTSPKCQYQIPQILCMMYIGENIVFDANQGKCVIQSGGCDQASVRAVSFSSFAECEQTCPQGASSSPINGIPDTFDKCSYQAPEVTCAMYIGDFHVFDSKTGRCMVQSSGCSRGSIERYAFASQRECEASCGRKLIAGGQTSGGSASVQEKCSYKVPDVMCQMYIGENVVFDSNTRLCTVQSSGCNGAQLSRVSFSSREECQKTCGTGGFVPPTTQQPPSSGNGDRRCSYRVPDVTCQQFIGNYIVYDSARRVCRVQRSGCDQQEVSRNAFASPDQCQRTCMNSGSQLTTTQPANTVNKCSYQLPQITCEMYIGEYVVYDSTQRRCTTQNSGCSATEVQKYAFSSTGECQSQCMGGNSPTTTISNQPRNRCSYQIPEITCQSVIGNFFVYNSRQRRCVVQTTGCSAADVAPYSFRSMSECQQACVIRYQIG